MCGLELPTYPCIQELEASPLPPAAGRRRAWRRALSRRGRRSVLTSRRSAPPRPQPTPLPAWLAAARPTQSPVSGAVSRLRPRHCYVGWCSTSGRPGASVDGARSGLGGDRRARAESFGTAGPRPKGSVGFGTGDARRRARRSRALE